MALDQNTRTQIVIAALSAAGEQREDETPAEHEARAAMLAAQFAAIVSNDRHPVVKAVDQIVGENTKVFTGTVESIRKEASSTRGVVLLRTGTTRTFDGVPEGCEIVRTERTDNPTGLAMAQKVRGLVGEDVVVWIEVEPIGDGSKKSRVLRHIAVRPGRRDS